jgi:hypothetical protein
MNNAPNLDQEMQKLERRLPHSLVPLMRRLRDPAARWVRVPAGILLVAVGILGFLPIIGFWMIPLGLALLSLDIPRLRTPIARLMHYINGKLEKWQ